MNGSGDLSTTTTASDAAGLEIEAAALGRDLSGSLRRLVSAVGAGRGPMALSRAVGVDKVLASRILGAVGAADPIGAIRRMPGPEPLRRFVKATATRGAGAPEVQTAREAIDRFERMIRARGGDRSGLDAMLSAWVPEARQEFELRRKQAAFRAISQIKGVAAKTLLATVVITPSADIGRLDVTWVNGLFGLHRVRPGAVAKLATRRVATHDPARVPRTLDGQPIGGGVPLLEEYCSSPLPALEARAAGEVVHYTLGGGDGAGRGGESEALGAEAAVDLVFAERNLGELARYVDPAQKRWAFFFAEAQTPVTALQFDVFVHEDVYPGQVPTLRVYDTVGEGVASPNDPTRDFDEWPVEERIEVLGGGGARRAHGAGGGGITVRSADVPRYAEMMGEVWKRLGIGAETLRGYRCRVAFPLHGSQVTMVFGTVAGPQPHHTPHSTQHK